MTNLSLNNAREFSQLEGENKTAANTLSEVVRTLFPASTATEKQTSFIDAWLLSSNGQG